MKTKEAWSSVAQVSVQNVVGLNGVGEETLVVVARPVAQTNVEADSSVPAPVGGSKKRSS